MAIEGFDRNSFVQKLNENVTASRPIQSVEHLFGREQELRRIDEALQADGRHAFIYGDRGVGKSSLAATVAAQLQSADQLPITIGCAGDTTFYGTIEEVVRTVMRLANGQRRTDVTHKLDVLGVYHLEVGSKSRDIEIPKVDSMYAALDAIKLAAAAHSKLPVVVVDEFDQIAEAPQRSMFASFLKGLGDSGINVKFIFTGVASSLDELLGSHESSYRQLHTEPLEKLIWAAREEIVSNAAGAFGLEVDPELNYLIAKISNGFPYYIHLITEHLLWQAFNRKEMVTTLGQEHFDEALKAALHGISAQLQRPYNAATAHRSSDYRDIIWATADSESDFRSVEAMFKSYLRINRELHGEAPPPEYRPLPKSTFAQRIGSLKKESMGRILLPFLNRRGMYCYRENILKGFVAMKAYEAGVELQGDVADAPKVPTAMARIRKGQAGKASDYVPKGIKFRNEKGRSHEDSED